MKSGTILWLSLKDLRHELLSTLNLILGTAAIIAPLLILFGIKFGTIETMRNRLLNDPKNLEIRPLSSRSYDREWFANIERDDRIAFAIPLTRKLASSVTLYDQNRSKRIKVDLIPTKDGDPIVLQNSGTIPTGRHALLSSEAAKALGVKSGEKIILSISRYMHRKIERVSVDITIDAILDPRAGFLKSIYLTLDMANSIEHYKDGLAVEELGWSGTAPVAYAVYDGVFIESADPIDKIEQIRLISGTGFSTIDQVDSKEAEEIAGYPMDKRHYIYHLKPHKNRVLQTNIDAVAIKLRGKKVILHPWIEPLDIKIANSSDTKKLYAAPHEWNLTKGIFYTSSYSQKDTNITIIDKKRRLEISASMDKLSLDKPYIYVDAGLAGELSLLRDRELRYDKRSNKLLIARRGYAGFRLYAKKLEDVESLKKSFETMGIDVSTQAERIHDVQQLDRYLSLIFWLISIVGVVGGIATLGANLYASTERKRREFSILRLLGISKGSLFRFPLYQGLLVSTSGVLVALSIFLIMAKVINTLFGDYLSNEESFCSLSADHLLVVFAIAISVAVISSLLAATKATNADPAEAMRDE
ncbi:ABC-type antimicrobial peptide transport system, permease component [hydrothermal vent metagenome]|uniref:ABC-type antimicrobial peptide transport system, permease component n=1 Tax=hydrothermal vent metagenome TaxID=652676 RepID=A0A1W1CDA7_9ZZZZ